MLSHPKSFLLSLLVMLAMPCLCITSVYWDWPSVEGFLCLTPVLFIVAIIALMHSVS